MRTPLPALTNEQSRRSSLSANSRLIGTLSALASASSVASDGEIEPFSIFDSMPAEMPAAAPELGDRQVERLAQAAHLGADPVLQACG